MTVPGHPRFTDDPTVVVVGAGPAGRSLTHRLIRHGVATTLVDPHPTRSWTPTYAAWTDELPGWVHPEAIAATTAAIAAHAHRPIRIDRSYTVFHTDGLQRSLAVDDATVITARAREVAEHHVVLDDGRVLGATHVIDCRGPTGRPRPRQTAFGVVVPTAAARTAIGDAEAVLMDWRAPQSEDSWDADGPAPSFLYAVPVADDRTLLEETCLVGDPAVTIAELAQRLSRRLAGTGIDSRHAGHTERVSFPMLGATLRPWRCRPLRHGAAGGLLNPTTGYGVAAMLTAADDVAAAIVAGSDAVSVMWPARARAVWRLRVAGLGVLLDLDPAQTVDFFDAFLSLPPPAQRAYLSDRADLAGTLTTMARVFGTLDASGRRTVLRSVSRVDHAIGRASRRRRSSAR
nr:lycopene cyclase family protein [Gordonia desulfuricans]